MFKTCFHLSFDRCSFFECPEASEESLLDLGVHTAQHIQHIVNISSKSERIRTAKTAGDIFYSKGSSRAALLAVGGVIKVRDIFLCSMNYESSLSYSNKFFDALLVGL